MNDRQFDAWIRSFAVGATPAACIAEEATMDADHFDAIAKTLIRDSPRRTALRLLAGGGLAGLLALRGWEGIAGRRIKPGHRCKKKGKKVGKCVEGAFCNKQGYCKCRGCLGLGNCTPSCGGACCSLPETCVDGSCRLERCPPPDWYVCGATCCKQGYVCCADQPFCCDPGLRCNPTGGCRQ